MILEVATVGMMYMADATPTKSAADYLNPISVVVSVADKVTNYIEEKNKSKSELFIPQEKMDEFKKWGKEDFVKDDPYKEMWDLDWINQGENNMAYVDKLKELLAKKNEQQNQGKKKNELDIGKGKVKDQVISHKPAKKSAGRGR
jgi:hypothetical protein